ncbi:MAG: hypothetical protein ACLP9L_31205 [Thermoguttaceae bacterium]
MKPLWLIGVAACLFASGCDSKYPLSDPRTSKADQRLVGVWLDRSDGNVYYYVANAGEKSPACMMRVVGIKHNKGTVEPSATFLVFPTVLGDKTYLNVALGDDDKLVKSLHERGGKTVETDSYTFYKYEFDGDKLLLYAIDEEAKQKAIKSGKVRGKVENNSAKFTDSTEHVARLVAGAGNGLWDAKKPIELERVSARTNP